MCAPNKNNKREQDIYLRLFCTHLLTTMYVMVSGCLGAMSRMKFWFSSSDMDCMSMDSIIKVFYHINEILIATKHIAYNNLVFQ